MKSLMLLNPRRKKRRSKRKVSARRTTRRRRTTRKVTARRMTARRTTRRRRSSRRSFPRTVNLRRGRAVTIRANPRRRSRRGGLRLGAGSIMSQVKGVFSKENLTVAAGGVGAAMLTNKVLSLTKADGTTILPMGTDENTRKAARLAYLIGIPVAGAIVTRKFNPSLAKGMLIGGLINGMIEGLKTYAPAFAKQVGFAEYLEYTPMSALNGTPGYSAINQFSTVRPMNGAFSNSSAFPADAWGR